MIKFCNRVITYSFYALFFIVPLIFTNQTSELFELNKMWTTWAITIIITAFWLTKMVLQKKIAIQRTPLDIPIGLFLLSQIISTFISLDPHVSFWGYYSRFNGGLLSTISYVLLYYGFISNLNKKEAIRSLYVGLTSCIIVALWGFPAHFGADPTCYLFRGNFDVSCWTAAFQPKIRIFSTLGQPNWMAAYLSIFLLITTAFFLRVFSFKSQEKKKNSSRFSLQEIILIFGLLFCLILFYLDLIFTNSQSGFLGFFTGLVFFLFLFLFFRKKTPVFSQNSKKISLLILLLLVISFFAGTPLQTLHKFTYQGLTMHFASNNHQNSKPQIAGPALESNITSSWNIRKIVWKGAIDIWKDHPIFGTGVETFAFAYYLYRPAAHNMTSEWDYLYNKAHNEYLNYLATTGIFGLGTYLSIIAVFFFVTIKNLFKAQPEKILIYGLLGAFTTMLVSNFVGFSVVITNIYLFIIPATVFFLLDLIKSEDLQEQAKYLNFSKHDKRTAGSRKKEYFARNGAKDGTKDNAKEDESSLFQGLFIVAIGIFALFLLMQLYNFWQADVAYALGTNYDRVGKNSALYIEQANTKLREAVKLRSDEPVFQDELALNDTLLSLAFFQQKDATSAADFARQADALSTQVVTQNPNNVVFWKNRVQIYNYLSELTPQALLTALDAIKHAQKLAPTDAKIAYSLGVLYSQTGHEKKAIAALKKTIALKPDYRDAYYALGIVYHYSAIDKNQHIVNPEYEKNAVIAMHYILDHLSPTDQQAIDALKSWGEK